MIRTTAWMLVLILAGAQRVSGQLHTSWDEPRLSTIITEHQGAPCVAGEILVTLDDVGHLPELQELAEAKGDRVAGFIPALAVVRLVLAPGSELGPRLEAYARLDVVRRADPNHAGVETDAGEEAPTPSDPLYDDQWHLDNVGQSGGTLDADVDAPEAWLITRGSPNVVLAYVGFGLWTPHPEFEGRLLPGWDFVSEDPDPITGKASGTQAVGIAAANAQNDFEVVGLDHFCRILPVKSSAGILVEFDYAQGLDFAVANGADVISMTTIYPEYLPLMESAIGLAAESGAVVVTGNGVVGLPGFADKTWPAASPKTLSVGWTGHDDMIDKKSSSGSTLDFVAPGRDVVGISASGLTPPVPWHGPYYAMGIVSGIVALMKSLNSSLTYEQVYDLLVAGAEDQLGDPLDTPGWDPWYGHGRVNARASLEALCGCTGGESLIASPQLLPASTGGVVELVLDFGRHAAHQPYLLLGSATSGGGPFVLGGVTLRLTPDHYLLKTLGGSDGVNLVDTSGLLDAHGRAHALIVVPTLPVGPADLVLFHQAVVFQAGHPAQVSQISNKTKTVIAGS